MPTSRCYNCGIQGHQTQSCPSYGPRYPEPGKTSEDYAAKKQEIDNKIAADILREHRTEDHDHGDSYDQQRDARRAARAAGSKRTRTKVAGPGGSPPSDGGPREAA